jgi:hypothetical protein
LFYQRLAFGVLDEKQENFENVYVGHNLLVVVELGNKKTCVS